MIDQNAIDKMDAPGAGRAFVGRSADGNETPNAMKGPATVPMKAAILMM